MKRKHADIDRMVMESHYLESLEMESSPSLSDMGNHKQREQHQVYLDNAESQMMETEGQRQDYIDQINDLKATIERLLGMIDALKQAFDTVSASNRRNEELVVKLTAQIEELQKLVKNLEE